MAYRFAHNDDLLEIDYATWGKEWIDAGMRWKTVNPPPLDWDPEKQLKRLQTGSSERGERGQAMAELAGVLLVVALIVPAVFASGLTAQV